MHGTKAYPLITSFICLFILSTSDKSVQASGGLFDWIWGSEAVEAQPKKVSNGAPLVAVPFESQSDDEKFLQEAAKYTSLKLSDLDACQHKVVMKIRGSCSSMSEEDLAKMSVNLLNCQSSVEGRQEFPCTDSMTLRECTGKMDADMWNTYHLMNNRARAVCYAARHQQFRALSEMTVNKLMNSAHDQLAAMAILKEGQHKLESMTSNTLEVVAEGHKTLTQQQERLRNTQQSIQDFVALNLRQLTREKALIAAGHSELARLTADVKGQLDAANEQLTSQAAERRADHMDLVKDLGTIQEQAHNIWDQIEQSTTTILSQHAQATAHYEDTLVKLRRINQTVNFLLQLVDQTRLELDIRLEWISSLVGGTGNQLERLYTCLLHGLYLLVAMIATAFLQAPMLTRVCLLLIVPFNLTLTFNQGPDAALNYYGMTIAIAASAVVQWVLALLFSTMRECRRANANATPVHLTGGPPSAMPKRQLSLVERGKLFLEELFVQLNWRIHSSASTLRRTVADEPEGRITSGRVHSWVSDHSGYRGNSRGPTADDSSDSDAPTGDSPATLFNRRSTGTPVLRQRVPGGLAYQSPPTPSRSGTPASVSTSMKPYCTATCRNGQPCRNSAVTNSDVCRRHAVASPYR